MRKCSGGVPVVKVGGMGVEGGLIREGMVVLGFREAPSDVRVDARINYCSFGQSECSNSFSLEVTSEDGKFFGLNQRL